MTDNIVRMTAEEADAFKLVMTNNYGACQCQPQIWPRVMCPGHRFLEEDDRHVRRVDRMLWVRRTRMQWIDKEMLGKCGICDTVGACEPGDNRCRECRAAAEADRPAISRLPW